MALPPRALGPAVALLARDPDAAGKTRLGPLPPDAAAVLRRTLLLDTLDAALRTGWPVRVFVAPAAAVEHVRAIVAADDSLTAAASRLAFAAQPVGDLGERMTHALAATLAAGHDVAVLVGSDLPDLPPDALADAAARLADDADGVRIVLGPAEDGGFYLVATRVARPDVFAGVAWGGAGVLDAVTARAGALGLVVALVRPWHDVDTAADLAALGQAPETAAVRTRRALAALTPDRG
jgi:rSAM/selenodomain-associated transferase 1